MVQWLLEDLLQLALYKYSAESGQALDEKQPFNCTCVKEIWTMTKLLIETMHPDAKTEVLFIILFEK